MITKTPREVATSFVLDRLERALGVSLDSALKKTLYEEVEALVANARAESRSAVIEESLNVLEGADGQEGSDVEDRILAVLQRFTDETLHLGKPDEDTFDGYVEELGIIVFETNERARTALEEILDDDDRTRVVENAVTMVAERSRKLP